MLLVIAEKPNQAHDIAEALLMQETVRREATYFRGRAYDTGEEVVVAFCAGHLLEMVMPEFYNQNYANWRLDDLPIKPPGMRFILEPRDSDAKRLLEGISRHYHGAREIINACDAGREGELIFSEVARFLNFAPSKLTTRMWIQDPTEGGLRKAFKQRQRADGKILTRMREVALLRQQADWLYGVNMSRYVTLASAQHPKFPVKRHAVGRVMTAVLGMVHDRSETVSNFVAEPYYRIRLTMRGRDDAFTAYLRAEEDQQFGRSEFFFKDYEVARDLARDLHFSAHDWTVFDEMPEAHENPPEPFSLVELQRSCWRIFGWSAKYTLSVAQECYAREKTLTYPRTESFHLPMSMRDKAATLRADLWEKHILTQYKEAKRLPPFTIGMRYFKDDDKMEEHHAIIPTGTIPSRLDARGAVKHTYLLWDLVVRRFVMSLQTAAVYRECSRILIFTDQSTPPKDYRAIFKSQPLVNPAWLETEEIIGNTRGYGKALRDREREAFPDCENHTASMLKIEVAKDYTKRPEEYTDDTILGTMLRMKLGTAATRAETVEKLIVREYIERSASGSLIPRVIGSHLVSELKRLDAGELLSPEVTAKWEKAFDEIEKGAAEYKGAVFFLDALMSQITNIGGRLIAKKGDATVTAQDDGKVYCPISFERVNEDENFCYFKGFDKIPFPKVYVGRKMTAREWRDVLVANPKVGAGPFDGFRGKSGPFKASVAFTRKATKWGHFKFIWPKERK